MISVQDFFRTELGLRIVSAIVLLIIILSFSWLGGPWFAILCVLISAALYYEWQSIVRQSEFDAVEVVLTLGFAALLIAGLSGYLIAGLVGFLLLGLVLEIWSTGVEKSDVRWIGLGALYCAIPAIAFPLIREEAGFGILMLLFLVVWATDIGGYFVGRAFGGAKLLPAVSPKKTWSGAIGGLACAVVVGLIFSYFYQPVTAGTAILSAVVLSVFSQIGDLFESWVKRLFGRKDSSQMIPGHGGFLDRVDGLVAAAVPVAFVVAVSGV